MNEDYWTAPMLCNILQRGSCVHKSRIITHFLAIIPKKTIINRGTRKFKSRLNMLTIKSLCNWGGVIIALGIILSVVARSITAQEPEAPAAEAAPVSEGAEFIANYNPSKSFSRLLFPNLAALVNLTPQQQAEVSRLMTERSAALATTTDQNEWPAIVKKSEEEIKALLTPEQLSKFKQSVDEKLITIRFSKTKWADVLKWFSAELGLQLVMNAPPPGTFSYNDKNQYTPREALDILNGRLQFQGYTLLRTGNMLYVHNFKDGPIPMQFLPKITLAELPDQSRFSYVALTLPLERRPLSSVLEAIKPFQGPYNATQPLSANSLMIIDSVNALREIIPAAMAIASPALPPVKPLAAPVWKTYQLEKITPYLVKTEVEKVVPSALPIMNPSSNQIQFLAIPEVHTVIEGLVKGLEEGGDPTKDLITAVYPLDDITNMSEENVRKIAEQFNMPVDFLMNSNQLLEIGDEIVEALKFLCPEAVISFNKMTKQIMVVARPADQEKIKNAVSLLHAPIDEAEKETFSVYPLNSDIPISPNETRLLQQMLPTAHITFSKSNNSIAVVGTKQDQERAAAAIEELKTRYAELGEERTYTSFPMTAKQLTQFNAVFDEIKEKPEMEGLVKVDDPQANRVNFWGTRRQLEAVRIVAEQITGNSFPALELESPENAVPAPEGAEGSANDPESSVNLTVASESDDSLKVGNGTYMKMVRLEKADQTAVTALLTNTIPGLAIDTVANSKMIVIYGSQANLSKADTIIESLEAENQKCLKTIPYSSSFPMSALEPIKSTEPEVSVTLDPARKLFILLGPEDGVTRIAGQISEFADIPVNETESVRYVNVEREIPADLISYIQRVLPFLRVTYDSTAKRFILFGNAEDQEKAVQMIASAETSLPSPDETRFYPMETRVEDEYLNLVREALPEAKEVIRNIENPKVLVVKARPEIQEKVTEVLAQIDAKYPGKENNIFICYPFEKELQKTFDDLLPEFIKENGELHILGHENGMIGVWGTPLQHTALGKFIDQIRTETKPEELAKTVRYYEPQYREPATLISLAAEIVPNASASADPDGKRIVIKGTEKNVTALIEFLQTIDIKPSVSEQDRMVRILPRRLRPEALSGLIRAAFPKLSPIIDSTTGTLIINIQMVPKEDVLDFVDLVDPESPSPLEPTLKVYTFEKTPTQAMADTLLKLVPNARTILQPETRRLMVIARPSELAIVDQNISAIEGAVAPAEPFVKFYAFDKEPTDDVVKSLTDSLKKIAPEATVEVNKTTRQLMVIAKANDHEKIEENVKKIVETFNPVDLKMVVYPISGMETESLKAALLKIYPDIKIETDIPGRRLMIWATLDQHVRISEEIAAVNAKQDSESPDYTGPKCVVYTAQNGGEARMLQRLIRTMFPAAEVYTESLDPREVHPDHYQDEMTYWTDRIAGEQKITVLATAQEQELIASLFEQHRTPANRRSMRMETWQIVNLEPEAVEATLQNLLADAISLSPPEVAKLAYVDIRRAANDDAPFFRVDPRAKTVAVYADDDALAKVKGVLERMTEAGKASEMSSSVHTLVSPIAPQILSVLRKQIPAAQFTAPDNYQIIAFATDADHKTIDNFLRELSDLETSDTHYIMKSVFLPEDCIVPRDNVVHYLTVQFLREKGYAYTAANPDQIILWGTARVLDEMTKFIDETCGADQEKVYRTYPVDNITPAAAVALLKKIAPNAVFTPDVENKRITVLGSSFAQKMIETSLVEIDAKRTGDAALTAEYYNMEGLAAELYPSVYTALLRQFPHTVIVADAVYRQFTVVATEKEQELIGEFFATMKEKRLETAPVFQVYTLQQANYQTLLPIMRASVPGATTFAGKRPSEFYTFAKPEDQEKVRKIVAKVDTIEKDGPEGLTPKIYRVDAKHTASAVAQLAPSLPNAQLHPLTGGGVLMWGSPSDHEMAEKYFGTFAEAYPEPVIRRYSLKHIKYIDASTLLTRSFPLQATFYPSSTGDMLIEAEESVHQKIAETLSQIDVPLDDDIHPSAAAYDISELPAASQKTAVSAILKICPESTFLPTADDGYFVIYAKPKDQEKIADLIARMVADSPNRHARMEKYTLRNITYADAVKLLAQIAPNAKPSQGKDENQIYVWAKETDHAKIADAIGKLNEEVTDGIATRVYHLKKANLTQTQTALRTLFPTQLQSIIDPASRTITVRASEVFQAKAAELIAEIDRNDAETQTSIKVFNITGISSAPVLTHLKSFYVNDPDFKVNYDAANQSLVVQGSAEQIRTTAELIDQIRNGGLSDPGLSVKTYTLRNSWDYYTLRNVFTRQGRSVDMQLDYATGKLIVFGRPEEHKTIENILIALAPEPTVLAVYDLKELEPETAASIISSMLENDGTFVDVQSDEAAGKLYIRATEEKQAEIRQFLIEAGEVSLRMNPKQTEPKTGSGTSPTASSTPQVQGNGVLRTINAGSNGASALQQVHANWTGSNPIHIITGNSERLIQTKEHPEGEEKPASDQPPADKQTETESAPPVSSLGKSLSQWMSVAALSVQAADTAPAPAEEEKKPIYAITNPDGTLTITSADKEALDKFQNEIVSVLNQMNETQTESADDEEFFGDDSTEIEPGDLTKYDPASISASEKNLRTLARWNKKAAEEKLVMEDRNYSVYKVENVSVDMMISRLNFYMSDKLTTKTTTPAAKNSNVSIKPVSSGPRLKFQPDTALNTIMVTGRKSDRMEAGALIAVLDKAELFPQPITKPVKVPVRNTSVTKMAQQVLNVFQMKFMTTQLPGGLSPRILPNTDTNTLEIFAPKELTDEIAAYVKESDAEIMQDKTSQVKIVPLEELNALVFQKYINNLTGTKNNFILVSPYTISPQYTRQPRQF